jgi:uncharacterized protein YjeT (DUF2065 family)
VSGGHASIRLRKPNSESAALLDQLLTAFALVLFLEGVCYALFPDLMRRLLALALMTPVGQLRLTGLIAAVAGVGLVWLMRS